MSEQHDFIIVGAGSAGAALASRLTENRRISVLLLEAGGSDRRPWVRIPLGVGRILNNPDYVWQPSTEPEPELAGNRIYWPSGRIVGGSSSVNGMLFVRGHPSKYEEWRAADCPGWGWADVLPYFKKLEDYSSGDPRIRGRGGPIGVTRLPTDALTQAFIDSCVSIGLRYIDDYNVEDHEGVASIQVSTRRGIRSSTGLAYLSPARRRINLRVETDALVTRVILEGRRAVGVEYRQGGELRTVLARREVILSAGAVRSPLLLELSGIGRPDVIKPLGIEVLHPLAGVGENLQDHIMPRIGFETSVPITVNDLIASRWMLTRELVRYAVTRKGIFATPSLTALAYARTRPTIPFPDVRLQMALNSGTGRLSTSRDSGLDPFPGFHMGGYFLYPHSRGSTHARSRDPAESPSIRANYLAHEIDRDVTVRLLKLLRRISEQLPLKKVIVREVRPGCETATDDALLDYARRTASTCWHPTGTCRMGRGAEAVVDPQLRVHGLSGLRVVDHSVVPFITSSNTNIPAIMIAEKGADMIKREIREAAQ